MRDIFDQACDYAAEIGIPADQIEDIAANAELCCEGPGGNGVCAENTKAIIDAAAKQFNPPSAPTKKAVSRPSFTATSDDLDTVLTKAGIASFGLIVLAISMLVIFKGQF